MPFKTFPIAVIAVALLVLTAPLRDPRAETKTTAAAAANVLIVAGGCFWCVESDFDRVPGVLETVSGYTGGHLKNPTYEDVSHGASGHYEAVRITFDPAKVSYADLLEIFWRSVDPTDDGGQFCDRGMSYKTAIFPTTPEQTRLAELSKQRLENANLLKSPVATRIIAAQPFYPAEDYHQNYYRKNTLRYRFYRLNCGRDRRVEQVWGAEAYRGIDGH